MKKKDIKNYLSECGLTEKDIETHISIYGFRGKWKFKDGRTYKDDLGMYHVYPYGFTERQIYIACPLCGETHFHGRTKNDKYQGHRVKHCRDELIEIPGEYVIEKLDPFTEKRLINKHHNRKG